ncbi:MAG TPA: hypothetical protein VF395_19855 [Polyangiaceae bacterium]
MLAVLTASLTAACSGGSTDGTAGSGKGGAGAGMGANGGAGGDMGRGASASDDGAGGDLFTTDGSTGTAGGDGTGDAGFKSCTGLAVASEQVVQAGKLDIYLVFDRTASMGQDCAFTPGTSPPVASKACFATYAIAQYFMSAKAADDTHLAFQFMSLATDDCNGTPYATPGTWRTDSPTRSPVRSRRSSDRRRCRSPFPARSSFLPRPPGRSSIRQGST